MDGLTKEGTGARKIGGPFFSVPSFFSQNKSHLQKKGHRSI